MKFIFAFLFSFTFAIAGHTAKANYQTDMEKFLNDPSATLADADVKVHEGYQYVLLPGVMNELSQEDYFKEMELTLTEKEIDVTRVYLSSGQSVEKNAVTLKKRLLEIYKKNPKKIILLGHSKAGGTAILTMIQYPELMSQGIVAEVIGFEGVIGGNELFANLPVIDKIVSMVPSETIRTLNSKYIKNLIASALEELRVANPAAYQQLNDRLNYILGSKDVEDMHKALKTTTKIIAGDDNTANDGMVAKKHQLLEQIGLVIADLNVNHIECVASLCSSKEMQRSFALAMLKYMAKKLRGDTKDFRSMTVSVKKELFGSDKALCSSALK